MIFQIVLSSTIVDLKQAGAELCQAQAQVNFFAQAELNLTFEFDILVLLENIHNYN